jgi:hypothetical protein
LLALVSADCYATGHVPIRGKTEFTRATGVTMRSGEEIEFAADGATIENDTLHAIGDHTSIAIPTDSIARVSVRKFSWGKTTGLVVGVGTVAFVVLGLIALRHWTIN